MVRDRTNSVYGLTDAELHDHRIDVLFLVWLLYRASTSLVDKALTASGLRTDEYAIYSILDVVGPMTPTALARWMAVPATTVSSHIKRFEARGHVSRRRHEEDGRSYLIGLTPSGRSARRTAKALFDPVRDRVERSLADTGGGGKRAVSESLVALRNALDNVRGPADETAPSTEARDS